MEDGDWGDFWWGFLDGFIKGIPFVGLFVALYQNRQSIVCYMLKAVFNMMIAVVAFIGESVPTDAWPYILDATQFFVEWWRFLDQYFPLTEITGLIAVWLVYWAAVQGVRWIIKLLRG